MGTPPVSKVVTTRIKRSILDSEHSLRLSEVRRKHLTLQWPRVLAERSPRQKLPIRQRQQLASPPRSVATVCAKAIGNAHVQPIYKLNIGVYRLAALFVGQTTAFYHKYANSRSPQTPSCRQTDNSRPNDADVETLRYVSACLKIEEHIESSLCIYILSIAVKQRGRMPASR